MSSIWKQASGTALGVLIGLGAGAAMYARAAPKQDAQTVGVVRAQRFELVDEQGHVIGSFGVEASEGQDKAPAKEKMVALMIKSPGIAGFKSGDNPKDIPSSDIITLGVLPGGGSILSMMGARTDGQNHKADRGKVVQLGFAGNTGSPTLKLSDDFDDKKARIIKP